MTKVEKVWSEYQKKLFSFIQSTVETPEDTEDILDDVFEKLTKQL
jgi:DNA-directed RNA polymerase specialized sigma24 family protein